MADILGKVADGVTADPRKVRFADWDGDGRADYIPLSDSGAVDVYSTAAATSRATAGPPSAGWPRG